MERHACFIFPCNDVGCSLIILIGHRVDTCISSAGKENCWSLINMCGLGTVCTADICEWDHQGDESRVARRTLCLFPVWQSTDRLPVCCQGQQSLLSILLRDALLSQMWHLSWTHRRWRKGKTESLIFKPMRPWHAHVGTKTPAPTFVVPSSSFSATSWCRKNKTTRIIVGFLTPTLGLCVTGLMYSVRQKLISLNLPKVFCCHFLSNCLKFWCGILYVYYLFMGT